MGACISPNGSAIGSYNLYADNGSPEILDASEPEYMRRLQNFLRENPDIDPNSVGMLSGDGFSRLQNAAGANSGISNASPELKAFFNELGIDGTANARGRTGYNVDAVQSGLALLSDATGRAGGLQDGIDPFFIYRRSGADLDSAFKAAVYQIGGYANASEYSRIATEFNDGFAVVDAGLAMAQSDAIATAVAMGSAQYQNLVAGAAYIEANRNIIPDAAGRLADTKLMAANVLDYQFATDALAPARLRSGARNSLFFGMATQVAPYGLAALKPAVRLFARLAPINRVSQPVDFVGPLPEETTTIFRVQGGTPPLASRNHIVIGADGNPKINRTTLNISVGDPEESGHP